MMTSNRAFYNVEAEGSSQTVLERLEELSIKNLDCQDGDDSPSYGSASLPTPEAPRADFMFPVTARPSPYHSPLDVWYAEGGKDDLVLPGAPEMKDLDSFTEGTGCGSFEDLPIIGTDEYDDPVDAVTSNAISLLPPPDSLKASIERWKENVTGSSVPTKRRRSPSPEGDGYVRRIRARTRAISLPPSFKAFTEFLGYPSTRSEPEAPD